MCVVLEHYYTDLALCSITDKFDSILQGVGGTWNEVNKL